MRRTLPLTITFLAGTFMILSFFFNEGTFVNQLATRMKDWGILIAAFAVVLGTGNILRVSIHKARRNEDRSYKIVLIACLLVTTILGITFGTQEQIRETWFAGAGGANPFYWVYENMQLPLGATMFSLLVFYITSAAYRAFRMRSTEAGILLVAAVVVMLGQVPWSSEIGLDKVMVWIMVVPNAAAKRAILMGAAMGIASMSLRVILGIERSYLGGD
ncbi:MAG: hypothetical protein ACC662_01320 [Planctomycetota bacterium]